MANLDINGILRATNGGSSLLKADLITSTGQNYIKKDSGELIAWGTATAGLPFSVQFDNPNQIFANTNYAVIIIPLFNSTAGSGGFWVKNKSTTGFEGTATVGFGTIQWLAIGYWK